MSEHLTNIVVCGLIHRQGQIFVARRAKTKQTFPDQFELIGGHVDPGEELKAALRREIKEEIQLDVIVGQAVDAFTYQSEGVFKVEVVYLCSLAPDSGEPIINPTDHSEGRWITAQEIKTLDKEDDEVAILRQAFTLLEKGVL